MSDRTVAIFASVMAAVSFVHDSVNVSLRMGSPPAARADAICRVTIDRETLVEIGGAGLRVRTRAAGEDVELLVAIRIDAL